MGDLDVQRPGRSSGGESPPVSKRTGKRKRQQVLVACNRCKRLKTRCDGVRPSCRTCLSANVTCDYDTQSAGERRSQAVKRQVADLESAQSDVNDSLAWLRQQSPGTVVSCLQQLRQASDPSAALCSVVAERRTQNRPVEIPFRNVLSASSPVVTNAQIAELVVRFPTTFPWLAEQGSLMVKGQDESGGKQEFKSQALATPLLQQVYAYRVKIRGSRPEQKQTLCDARLRDLDISFWTTVPIPDALAASLISSYIRVEQPCYGFFDPELFLQDLITQEIRYCSPLLVNSVLFWASCTFGPVYPQAQTLSESFLEAAQILLVAERNTDNALNVASLMILGISTICFSKDQLAKTLTADGVQMAGRMSLMGDGRRNEEQLAASSPEALSMLRFAAWGAFNFSTVYLCHFHDVHSNTYTTRPPLFSPPDSRTPSYGTPRARTARSTTRTSFPYFCQFWHIAHEIASGLYSCPGPIHQYVPLAFAESKLRSLLEWAESLPRELRRATNMPHNIAEMHICYHATIMDLFRPFLAKGEHLSTFATSPRRPEAIFNLSLSHLRALTRDYYSAFAGLPESHTISWVHGPLYVAPAILHYDRSDGWQLAFLSFIEACSDLLQAHRMMEGLVRALLGMAVHAGVFSTPDAAEYLDDLHSVCAAKASCASMPETGFVVDQDLAMEDRAGAVGDVLAQRFDEMLFQESRDFGGAVT